MKAASCFVSYRFLTLRLYDDVRVNVTGCVKVGLLDSFQECNHLGDQQEFGGQHLVPNRISFGRKPKTGELDVPSPAGRYTGSVWGS